MPNDTPIVMQPENGTEVQAFQTKELESFRAQMAVKTLHITKRMVDGLDTLLHRIEGVDDALSQKIQLDKASPRELYDYFNQMKESFRLRQDFLKTLSGYDVDTSKVKVEAAESVEATVISEEDAERIKAAIKSRTAE